MVLDYGSGNLHSAARALARAGARVSVGARSAAAERAAGLVVPGVGAFASCRAGLAAAGGDELIAARVAAGRPVLGICVGMQVLCSGGDEHGSWTPGLGLLPGAVRRLRAPILPHMGWDTLTPGPTSALFAGLDAGERYYFVHSYAVLAPTAGWPGVTLSLGDYGEQFVGAAEAGPLSAVQFHPEKSGATGARVLANWVRTL